MSAVTPKQQDLIQAQLRKYAAYSLKSLHTAWHECYLGTKTIESKKRKKKSEKLIVLTGHRLFVIGLSKFGKKPGLELDCHWFTLKVMDNSQTGVLRLTFQGKDHDVEIHSSEDSQLIRIIRTQIGRISKGFNAACLPELKMSADRVDTLIEESEPGPACGLFYTYRAACDYYGVPVQEGFLSFVEDIDVAQEYEMVLSRCPGTDVGSSVSLDMQSVLLSLAHNQYFNSLVLRYSKQPAVWRGVSAMLSHNTTLTKLVISNAQGDPRELRSVFQALGKNLLNLISVLDLSGNKVNSDASTALADAYETLVHGISVINFSDCSLSPTSLSELFTAMTRNLGASVVARILFLEGATWNEESNELLAYWLGSTITVGQLQHLSLRDCKGFDLHVGLAPLCMGASFCLTYLDLSGTNLDVPFLAQQIIGTSTTLHELYVENCNMGAADLDTILRAVQGNANLAGFHLRAQNNPRIGAEMSPELILAVSAAQNIALLDLRDAGFSFDTARTFLDAVTANLTNIESLFVGDIRERKRVKTTSTSLDVAFSLQNLLQQGSIYTFGLSSVQLPSSSWVSLWAGLHTSNVSALMLNGSSMGDAGIQALCHGLRQNESVSFVSCDDSSISLNGLLAMVGLLGVRSFVTFAAPINDIAAIQKPHNIGSQKWVEINAIVGELFRLGAVILADPERFQTYNIPAPDEAPAIVVEGLPKNRIKPPQHRDRKAFQEWRQVTLLAKMDEYARAAEEGGYQAPQGRRRGTITSPRSTMELDDVEVSAPANFQKTTASAAAPPPPRPAASPAATYEEEENAEEAPPPPPPDNDDYYEDDGAAGDGGDDDEYYGGGGDGDDQYDEYGDLIVSGSPAPPPPPF